jgi:hypothetical protein
MRSEQEIFDDLGVLCTSPGYVHTISFLCYRYSIVRYKREMTVEDMLPTFSPKRLIRAEMSTLIGLLIKEDIDYSLPAAGVLRHYQQKTEALLEEMHEAIGKEMLVGVGSDQTIEEVFTRFGRGESLREPIFYNGDSAYSSQYRDLSPRKYAADDEWLKANKGFTIESAREVVCAIGELQVKKLTDTVRALRNLSPDERTLLPGFSFTLRELSDSSGVDDTIVERVLISFSVDKAEKNQAFRNIQDFNVANATPILRTPEGTFVLFELFSLTEALYESPFYWMSSDKNYVGTAMIHRGRFTEGFSKERLELVFGKKRIYSNVNIYESKDKRLGEVDVLVLFGNRAIVLQAKSKRLTIEARRGNDRQIKDDFKKGIQDSYDQAFKCAKLLGNLKYKLIDGNSREIKVPDTLKEIYIVCVVCDSYPALNFQTQQLLKFERWKTIQAPLVTDVFTLDVMTEMLESPLYLLSYLNRRTGYYGRLLARDELTVLSLHLKKNLWIDDKYDLAFVSDDTSVFLDVAMAVRRDKVPGKRTPDGILTRTADTTLGRVIKQIEDRADSRTIDLGLMLLKLSEDAVRFLSKGIDLTLRRARKDGENHDFTALLSEAGTGLTVHCNDEPLSTASPRLQRHCEARKYSQKANSWFGICLSPRDSSVRFGVNFDNDWQPDAKMETIAANLRKTGNYPDRIGAEGPKKKVGRNDPCPCGSGSKYKKCCLNSEKV